MFSPGAPFRDQTAGINTLQTLRLVQKSRIMTKRFSPENRGLLRDGGRAQPREKTREGEPRGRSPKLPLAEGQEMVKEVNISLTEITITSGKKATIIFDLDDRKVSVPIDAEVKAYFVSQFVRSNPTSQQRKRLLPL